MLGWYWPFQKLWHLLEFTSCFTWKLLLLSILKYLKQEYVVKYYWSTSEMQILTSLLSHPQPTWHNAIRESGIDLIYEILVKILLTSNSTSPHILHWHNGPSILKTVSLAAFWISNLGMRIDQLKRQKIVHFNCQDIALMIFDILSCQLTISLNH